MHYKLVALTAIALLLGLAAGCGSSTSDNAGQVPGDARLRPAGRKRKRPRLRHRLLRRRRMHRG